MYNMYIVQWAQALLRRDMKYAMHDRACSKPTIYVRYTLCTAGQTCRARLLVSCAHDAATQGLKDRATNDTTLTAAAHAELA